MALQYTRVVDDHLLLVTWLCEQFFSTKNTFLTVSVITKLAKIKKQDYLIRTHCVCHVKYAMQHMSRDRLLQSITADSLLAPTIGQWLFCHQRHFNLGEYFVFRHLR